MDEIKIMDEIKEMLGALFEAFQQLSQRVDRLESVASFDKEDDGNLFVATLADAEILLDSNHGPSGAKYRKKLIDGLIKNDVRDDPRRYHNFISALSGCGDYRLILRLCDYLLTFAPLDRDILADAILTCGKLCEWELGMGYLSKAELISKERWNDKLFIYTGEFLKARFNAYPNDDAYYQDAMSFAEEFINYCKHDEHAYSLKAELLVYAQRRQEAIEFLLDTIRNGYSDDEEKNEKTRIVATQCCVDLLELLDDTCNYDLIIEICDKGLRYTHDQRSARISSFVYRRALAYDAKVYAQNFANKDDIVIALMHMQSAYTLVTNGEIIANEDKIIEDKYEALRPYAGEKFVPLIKRSLAISE